MCQFLPWFPYEITISATCLWLLTQAKAWQKKYRNFVAVVECHLCDQELGLYLFPVIHQLGFDHSV